MAIAYMLARDIALNAKTIDLDKDILAILITRIIKDIGETKVIRTLVKRNIENNREILKQIENQCC